MKNIRKRIACILLLVFCISNVASVLAASEPHRDQKTQSTILQATVAAASASYYVEIPEDISLGTLNSGHDMNYDYTVRVTMENKKDTDQVTVSSEDQISLRLSEKNLEKETDLLPCYNNFKTHTFTKSESKTDHPQRRHCKGFTGQICGNSELLYSLSEEGTDSSGAG